jgi:hypothetical protein
VNSNLHEILHCTVNNEIERVQEMGDDEHELGTIYSGGRKSPLASREAAGQSGECSSYYDADGESEELSWCEVEATEQTIEQKF